MDRDASTGEGNETDAESIDSGAAGRESSPDERIGGDFFEGGWARDRQWFTSTAARSTG